MCLPCCSHQQKRNSEVWEQVMAGQEAHTGFLPTHLPLAKEEKLLGDAQGGRA